MTCRIFCYSLPNTPPSPMTIVIRCSFLWCIRLLWWYVTYIRLETWAGNNLVLASLRCGFTSFFHYGSDLGMSTPGDKFFSLSFLRLIECKLPLDFLFSFSFYWLGSSENENDTATSCLGLHCSSEFSSESFFCFLFSWSSRMEGSHRTHDLVSHRRTWLTSLSSSSFDLYHQWW